MRIAIFVTGAFCRKEYEKAVSGHVQLPLKSGEIMVAEGHAVTLITTRMRPDDILPYGVAERFTVKEVQHATKIWPKQGVILYKALLQAYQLFTYLRKQKFDAVYFSGGDKVGVLLGLLSTTGINGRLIFSPIHRPPIQINAIKRQIYKVLFQRLDAIVSTSEYVREGWAKYCDKTFVLFPGVMKDMKQTTSSDTKTSVLFWRNANRENGADIALKAVSRVAKKFRKINFEFAVRPGDELQQELLDFADHQENVHVYFYPYSDGITLENLLSKSLFVLAPFRFLSMNPQMAVLETLYAGVPVIATNVESNSEVVISGKTGIIVEENSAAALEKIMEQLLANSSELEELRKNARPMTANKWNWRNYSDGLMQIMNI